MPPAAPLPVPGTNVADRFACRKYDTTTYYHRNVFPDHAAAFVGFLDRWCERLRELRSNTLAFFRMRGPPCADVEASRPGYSESCSSRLSAYRVSTREEGHCSGLHCA